MQNWLKLGDYNAICDSCGRKFKASTMRKRWDGMFVCKEDWEPKHPQLSLKLKGDKQYVSTPRPEPTNNTFVNNCTYEGMSSISGRAIAGCMIAGKLYLGNLT